jgi:hypothetical protein
VPLLLITAVTASGIPAPQFPAAFQFPVPVLFQVDWAESLVKPPPVKNITPTNPANINILKVACVFMITTYQIAATTKQTLPVISSYQSHRRNRKRDQYDRAGPDKDTGGKATVATDRA